MKPSLSIVIAVYNSSEYLFKCLTAITGAVDSRTEIIVVNDGSIDNSAEVGKNFGARVITLDTKTGAANARNIGVAAAQGENILFIDSDVIIKSETIDEVRQIFDDNPNVCAFFGSYDDNPGSPDFFSQYRNLMHHFFHQTDKPEAETFWSGFGAINRQTFLDIGGFNTEKFKIPSIEDIELGYRLRAKGLNILLVRQLQVKHLKKWTFYSILRTDFWQRAVPWVELMLLNPKIKHALNAKISQKISAVLVCGLISLIAVSGWRWEFLILALIDFGAIIFINRDFYAFFLKRKGWWFTLRVFPMHLLYFIYSTAAYLYCWVNFKIFGLTVTVR